MTKLSHTQEALLNAAAAEGGKIAAPAEAQRAAAGLIKRGLLTCEPVAEGPDRLAITSAGRAAIGLETAGPRERAAEPASAGSSPLPRELQPTSKRPNAPLMVVSLKHRPPAAPEVAAPPAADAAPPVKVSSVEPPPLPKGKIGTLLGLLRQPGGTTVEAMMVATGWQAHSVRGALSGAIKKGLGLEVVSEKTDAGRLYRIDSAAPVASEVQA